MRSSTRTIRSLAAALSLAAAVPALALPARSAPRTQRETPSGVFRLAMQGQGTGAAPATIILEHVADRVEITLLMDERVTSLTRVRADGDAIVADLDTSLGHGTITLHVDGDTLSGRLTVGKRVWTMSGKRSV